MANAQPQNHIPPSLRAKPQGIGVDILHDPVWLIWNNKRKIYIYIYI